MLNEKESYTDSTHLLTKAYLIILFLVLNCITLLLTTVYLVVKRSDHIPVLPLALRDAEARERVIS